MQRKYTRSSMDARAREFLETLVDSPQTRLTYTNALKAFYSFRRTYTKSAKDTPTPLAMRAMDVNVLERFQQWLRRHFTSRFTRQTYLAGASAFLEYGIDQGWLSEDFSLARARYRNRKSARRRESYPIPKPPPDDEVRRVMRYYDDLALPEGDDAGERLERLRVLRGRAVMHTLYATAARVSESASLTRKAVQDGRRDEAEVVGKGDKERFLFLTPDAKTAIAAYVAARHDTYEPLFIRHSKGYGKPLSRAMLWQIVVGASKACGVHLHPHELRHFRARQMLSEGAPLEAIQEILGHSDIGTTRRVYAQFKKKDVRAIFDHTTISANDLVSKGV